MPKISVGVLTLALLLAAANAASAQLISTKLIGAWTLQSVVTTDVGGNRTTPYGRSPIGQIVYTDTGRMGVHQMNPDAELPDFSGLTPSVALARFAGTFFAYWGTYTIDARAETVTHHLEGAMDQTYIGTDQVRQFEFVGDDTLLLTAVIDDELTREAGLSGTTVLTWERIR